MHECLSLATLLKHEKVVTETFQQICCCIGNILELKLFIHFIFSADMERSPLLWLYTGRIVLQLASRPVPSCFLLSGCFLIDACIIVYHWLIMVKVCWTAVWHLSHYTPREEIFALLQTKFKWSPLMFSHVTQSSWNWEIICWNSHAFLRTLDRYPSSLP